MSGLSAAVVHLTMCFDDNVLSTGSGVFYKRGNNFYIVTAWHNVTGRNTDTLEFLNKEHSAVPNNIIVTFKNFSFGGGISQSIKLPLYDDDKSLFFVHPQNWPRIDVVAIPFDPFFDQTLVGNSNKQRIEYKAKLIDNSGSCSIRTIQDYLVTDDIANNWLEAVSATEEVFIPGYPHNITDCFCNPVWKRATIASDPKNKWNNERKFLIDSASSSGMSGASVFYYDTGGIVKIGLSRINVGKPAAIHAGIYVGRLGVLEKADPQVGTVWHASVVDEIIDGEIFDYLSFEIELKNKDLEEAIREHLKTANAKGIENILNLETNSRFYVLQQVMDSIKGRASPSNLLKLILHITKNYDGPLVNDKS
ncbi:TPA: hypothetical protein ACSTJ0_003729 [Serratia fonticola]